MRSFATVISFVTSTALVAGADLRVYPPVVTVAGPNALQQLLVVDEQVGRAVADHTATAKYSTSNHGVAAVAEGGLVTAIGDGEATVTATVGGRTAEVKVRVERGPGSPGWNFRNHVEPVLTRTGCNSGACHGALAGKGGLKLSLRGYDPEADHFVLTRQAQARRVDQLDPDESLLLKKAVRALPHGGGRRFTDDSDHYQVLLDWVRRGGAGPKEADPALVRIELYPRAALLKPKDTMRVIVRAVYADGTAEDVTRWARFGSTEEQIAGVSEDGLVTVAGHGEAAITVGFGTRVGTLPVTSPFPAGDPSLFDEVRHENFIDDHVLTKLRLLNLSPSGSCTDAEFVRRSYLDACGILPRPDEVRTFLADPAADKRARLIDALLGRKEYVDYWSYKWSDLLLVSSRRLPQPAMWAFYRQVRQSVADNRPWDAFARDILTASGSTLHNGTANYFVLHKDTSHLAEATATTFLGTAIGCAKCHNHPLEKWTQDEYWAFANLFARVGLKAGDRSGEVFVLGRPDGDALHLRRGSAMPPAPLGGTPMPAGSDADRRRYFADWLTAADNPFFAKAVVNRVWRAYMGRGLVEAEDDLRDTNPPSHPELLDALAKDFVAHRYDLKHLTRTILNSAAYQRSSRPLKENAADDRFYSRYLIRRLPAEVILDAYVDVTQEPTPFDKVSLGPSGGLAASTSYPRGTRATELPDSLLVSRFLETFGRPERAQTCACERTRDSSVTQALHLNNGQTLNDKLRAKGSVVDRWLDGKAPDAVVVDRLFQTALARPPSATEAKRFGDALGEAGRDPVARREALEDLVWAVLTGREFLFNH